MAMKPSEKLMECYLLEVVGNGNFSLIDEMTHSDMVDEANQLFGGPEGRDGLIAHVKSFRKNIADPTIQIQHIIGNDDEVMAWWTFSGTHVGPWLNLEPSNEIISATVFSFLKLEQARIKRYKLWLQADVNPPCVFDGRLKSS